MKPIWSHKETNTTKEIYTDQKIAAFGDLSNF